jgi:O-antigen/teichoic acid export membrane protein
MARLKRIAKEGSWIVLGQIAAVVGALFLVRVLTEYLAPAEYGQLALVLTLASLVNQVVFGGVTVGVGRFYSIAVEREDLSNYLYAARKLLTYATVVVISVGLVAMAIIHLLGYSQWVALAAAALVLSVLSGYNSTLSGIQNAARQRDIVAFHSGLDAWLKVMLGVGFVLYLSASSFAVVIAYACSSLLITFSQLVFLRRTIHKQHTVTLNERKWISDIWSYSLPFSTWGAFTWMQQVSDRWALEAYESTSVVGEYVVLFQLGFAPIALVTGMTMSFLGPILYQKAGDVSNRDRVSNVNKIGWRMTNISLLITLLGFIATFTWHDLIYGFIVGGAYRGNSNLLPWLVLAGGFFSAGQMLALKLMSEMKSAVMTKAKITSALIGTLFNFVGCALAGLQGVVGGILAFSTIYFLWMAVLAKRLSNAAEMEY